MYKVAGKYGRVGWIASWYCEVVDHENPLHPVLGDLNIDVSKMVLEVFTYDSIPLGAELQDKTSGIFTYQDKFRKYYKGSEYPLGFVYSDEVLGKVVTDMTYVTLENGSSISGIHNHMTTGELISQLGWPISVKYSIYDDIEGKYIDTNAYVYSLDDFDIRIYIDYGFTDTVKSIEIARKGDFIGWLLVKSDNLNIRAYPSIKSDIISKTYENSIYSYSDYTMKSDDQNWYSINYNNRVAWISGDYVEEFDEENLEKYQQTERDYEAKREIHTNRFYTEELDDISDTFTLPIDINHDGLYEEMQVMSMLDTKNTNYPLVGEVIISIGDISQKFSNTDSYDPSISAVGIVDLYNDDHKVQFYVRYGDLADRMIYVFYEVVDQEFVEVFRFCGLIMGLSDDRKLFYWGGNLYEPYPSDFKKDLVLEYYDIYDGEYKTSDLILGKTIAAIDVTIVYKKYDDVLDGPPTMLEEQLEYSKNIRHEVLEIGEEFVVLEIQGRIAKIRTASGNVGWIGGFHMIWD